VIAGIDLGGTQVRVAVAGSDGTIGGRAKASTAALGGPEGMVRWTAGNIERLTGGRRLRAVGIGVPGPCDPKTGTLINPPNLTGWPKNLPLARLLEQELRAAVHLENDANLAAVAEHQRGAGKGANDLAYVTWSTGIGSGLILGGRLHSGAHGSAGEVGHMVLDPKGPLCACGMHGCTEAYASGSTLARKMGRPAAEVFAAARQGDPRSLQVVEEAAGMVGQALMNLANLVDPELIVIGGGITNSWGLVRRALYEPIKTSPFITRNRKPKLVRAALGTQVGLVGAVEWARLNL